MIAKKKNEKICSLCGLDCSALEYWRKHNHNIWSACITRYSIPAYLHKCGDLFIGGKCWKCKKGKRATLEART